MKRRWIAIVSVVTFLLTIFSACSQQQTQPQKKTESTEIETSTAAEDPFKEKIKFSINAFDVESVKDDKLDWLQNKFNVEMELINVAYNDWMQKIRTWIAAQDTTDVLVWDVSGSNYNEFLNYVRSGIFEPFPEISEFSELKEIIDSSPSSPFFVVDSKRYALQSTFGMVKYNNIKTEGYLYRRDWAEKLGIAHENDEYTLDEILEMAKAFVKNNMTGSNDTIGLAAAGPSVSFINACGASLLFPYWNSYYKKDGKYVWGPAQEEMLQVIEYVRKAYKEGALWQDNFTAKNNDANGKYAAGKAGIMYRNQVPPNVVKTFVEFKKAHEDVGEYKNIEVDKAIRNMIVTLPDGKLVRETIVDYWGVTSFKAGLDQKVINRVLAIYDWISSEEGLYFRTIGIEGKDYSLQNGKPVILWPKDEQGNYQSPYPSAEQDFYKMIKQWIDFGYEDPTSPEFLTSNCLATINNRINYKNAIDIPLDLKKDFFSAPNKDKYGAFSTEVINKIIEMAVTNGDVKNEWKAFVDSYKDRVQLVLDELNAME